MKPGLLRLLALFLALQLMPFTAATAKEPVSIAGQFDYYTLVLTWSPTYCDSAEGRRTPEQCGRNRRYAFVVHGLWPQNERSWPQNCRVPRGTYWLPQKVIDSMTDIMPARALIIHEWKKHGTCSGLSQKDYFGLTRDLYRRIKIPERYVDPGRYITTSPKQLEQDFIAANDWLDPSMVNVICGRQKRLRELRFCFSKDLKPRPCGKDQLRECRSPTLVLPPVR